MNLNAFKQAGHWPTLLSAFLYFDVSFMVHFTGLPLSGYLESWVAVFLIIA